MKSGNVQEEFAPYASLRGASQSTGVVATEGSVESLRGRMSEAERHPVKEHDVPFRAQVAGVEGLSPEGDAARFESVLNEVFHG